MDIKHFQYLTAVADAGSFSGGAQRAFVTQPTLSAAIAGIEAELGFKIFERHSRGVRLTPQGSQVVVHARSALSQFAAMKALGREVALPRKPLRLGVLRSLAARSISDALLFLSSGRDGAIAFRAEEAPLSSLLQRLTSGRFDAVLTSLEASVGTGISQLEMGTDAQVLAVPETWQLPDRITPLYLNGKPLIVRTHCEYLQPATRILEAYRSVPFIVAKTESDAHALAMVGAGIGACLVPDGVHHSGVKLVAVEKVRLRRRYGWQWVRGAVDGFFEELESPARRAGGR
jgi:DNA-binding transcriptional LysR family regulator